jgi:hypothetical protein
MPKPTKPQILKFFTHKQQPKFSPYNKEAKDGSKNNSCLNLWFRWFRRWFKKESLGSMCFFEKFFFPF